MAPYSGRAVARCLEGLWVAGGSCVSLLVCSFRMIRQWVEEFGIPTKIGGLLAGCRWAACRSNL